MKTILLLLFIAALFPGCLWDSVENEDAEPLPPVPTGKNAEVRKDAPETVNEETVWGVEEDMTFHRPDCERLKGVPESEKRSYKSMYRALDDDFHPCTLCRPELSRDNWP